MSGRAPPGIGHLDVRALRFLSAVLERRSVTAAGRMLGLSQPAASRLLAQLRRALGDDPLLVRAGRGFVLTPRAADLLPLLDEVLTATDRLFQPDRFDPATTTRTFRVATTDYGSAVVLTGLVADLDAVAPGLSLDVQAWTSTTLEDLEQGRLDLALYIDLPLPAGFKHLDLFEEQHACIVRRDHPVLAHRRDDGSIDPIRLAALPRVISLYPDLTEIAADDPLADFGLAASLGEVRTPYLLSAPLLVSRSDRLLCTTQRLAELMASMIAVEVILFPEGERFIYRAIWHERTDGEAGHLWLLKRLAATVGQ